MNLIFLSSPSSVTICCLFLFQLLVFQIYILTSSVALWQILQSLKVFPGVTQPKAVSMVLYRFYLWLYMVLYLLYVLV